MSATVSMDVTPHVIRGSVIDLVRSTLQRVYHGPHTVKRIARDIDRSQHTVKDWLEGKSAPSADSLVDLCAACDDLRDELLLMIQERKSLCGK